MPLISATTPLYHGGQAPQRLYLGGVTVWSGAISGAGNNASMWPLRGVNAAGAEFGTRTTETNGVYDTDASLAFYITRGANFVRIPFLWERMQPTLGGPLNATETTRLQAAVTSVTSRGAVALIDCHNYCRYTTASGTNLVLGDGQLTTAHHANLWTRLAPLYRDQPLVQFGIMNEPHDLNTSSGQSQARIWETTSQAVVDAIRATGATNYTWVPPIGYGSAGSCWSFHPRWWINDPLDLTGIEGHYYFDAGNSGSFSQNFAAATTHAKNTGYASVDAMARDNIDRFGRGAAERGVRALLGEIGWGRLTETAQWNAVGESVYQVADLHKMSVAYWAAGDRWSANYALTVYKQGVAYPPAAVVEAHKGPAPGSFDGVVVDPGRAPMALGVSVPGGPGDSAAVETFAAAGGGAPVRYAMFYQGWNAPFDITGIQQVLASGRTPILTWEPWAYEGPTAPATRLSTIISGAHDARIDAAATAIAATGAPVVLRFAQEMNGDWYPWSERTNANAAGDYVRAWRRVVDRFRARGATNVIFAWSPNVVHTGSTPLTGLYPGDSYVDVVAVDGYNFGTAVAGKSWTNPAALFGPTFDQIRAITTRPLWVGETASAEQGGDKAAWITSLFAYLKTREVAQLTWFNHVKEADWRITSTPEAATAWRGGVRAIGAPVGAGNPGSLSLLGAAPIGLARITTTDGVSVLNATLTRVSTTLVLERVEGPVDDLRLFADGVYLGGAAGTDRASAELTRVAAGARVLAANYTVAGVTYRVEDKPFTLSTPAAPGVTLPADIRTAAAWLADFDSTWASSGRNSALAQSNNLDSQHHYDLAYPLDACGAAFRASGDLKYLRDGLTLLENLVASSKPSNQLGGSAFGDNYRGWRSERSDVAGQEVPLFESYGWRYGVHLLAIARAHPAARADAAVVTRVQSLINFAAVNLFDKWYSRGAASYIYRSRVHISSHWARICMDLFSLTSDTTRRTRCEEVVQAALSATGPGNKQSIRDQMVDSTQVAGALFWSDVWDSFARPGQDVAHGAAVVNYVLASVQRDAGWDTTTLTKMRKTFTDLIWRPDGSAAVYVDGSGGGTGWFVDGWLQLGRYSVDLQRRLQGHQVARGPQFFANMALNHGFLSNSATVQPLPSWRVDVGPAASPGPTAPDPDAGIPADIFRRPFATTSVFRLGAATNPTLLSTTDQRTIDVRRTGADASGYGGGWINFSNYSHVVVQASNNDPLVTLTDTVSGGPTITIRLPATATAAAGSDKHLEVLAPDGKTLTEMFFFERVSGQPNQATCRRYARVDITGTGIGPQNGVRAFGGSAIAGLVRAWECAPGVEIQHPLALALRDDQLYFDRNRWNVEPVDSNPKQRYGYLSAGTLAEKPRPGWPSTTPAAGFMWQPGYIWPATEQDYNSPTAYTGSVPIGAYLVLPGDIDVNTLVSTDADRRMAYAAQRYGVYVQDRSGVPAFYVEHGPAGSNEANFARALQDSGGQYKAVGVNRILSNLRVVANNGPATPNGVAIGGSRRA